MIIIKTNNSYKIISETDLIIYKRCNIKIIGHLKGDYPSLKSLEIQKKNIPEFIEYLNHKIKEHNKLIKTYKIQLKKFKEDLSILGINQ